MGVIWGALVAVVAVLWIVTIVDIVRRHYGAGRTAGWILLVILLPFIGAIAYWSLRPAPPGELERKMAAERDVHRGVTPPRVGS